VGFSFKRLGRNWPNGFTSDTRPWYPKSEFTSLESSGVSLSIASPLQLCPEKLEKLQGVWIGYLKLMQLFKDATHKTMHIDAPTQHIQDIINEPCQPPQKKQMSFLMAGHPGLGE